MAAASRIRYEVERGSDVHCVFLTDGAGRGASPATRNAESVTVLALLGVARERIHFIDGIADGFLVHHLDRASSSLEAVMGEHPVTNVYGMAWEGGHQDHDASLLVAAAFAMRRNAPCWELPLYRGALGGRLFRVFAPRHRREWQRRTFGFGDGLRFAMLPRHYRSQRDSWAGLFPETFLNLGLLRRELMRKLDVSRLQTRPHAGTLLYERRFRFPYARFEEAARPFIDRHLTTAARTPP
jgi:LmbE family N-acetylglucosaminyl deacetylase